MLGLCSIAREFLHLLFRPLPLGNILAHRVDADNPTLGIQRRGIVPGDQTALAVPEPDSGLHLAREIRYRFHMTEGLSYLDLLFTCHELLNPVTADNLLVPPACQA